MKRSKQQTKSAKEKSKQFKQQQKAETKAAKEKTKQSKQSSKKAISGSESTGDDVIQ